jgi:endonuclease G
VSYKLAKEYFAYGAPKYDRLPKFLPDPDLPSPLQITHVHYTGTGYDRGHLAPNASMQGRHEQCARESFYMSNIAPQTAALNRKIWKNLEEKERAWAKEFGELWVLTGPVFEDPAGIKRMRPKKQNLTETIAIPTHFFKIFLRKEGAKHHALAFVIPNQKAHFEDDRDFELWQVAVDDVQELTSLDFFRNMEDVEEHQMEAAIEAMWK